MTMTDYSIDLILSVFLIVGGYQFYFWCQRNQLFTPREFRSRVDEWIPYRPAWVWIYCVLYFPVILYANLVVDSPRGFTRLALSYLLLLAFQMAFFIAFPVVTPEAWRTVNGRRTLSERFLAYLQSLDSRANSFPSMHVSVAMLTALHLYPGLGTWAFTFPVLIAVSCLFTKQHYVIDLPAGAALGWVVFEAYRFVA